MWNTKLHNDEIQDVYSSPNVIKVIKSKSTRWAWHVARVRGVIIAHNILVGKSEKN
jgi:hypothetical protein